MNIEAEKYKIIISKMLESMEDNLKALREINRIAEVKINTTLLENEIVNIYKQVESIDED